MGLVVLFRVGRGGVSRAAMIAPNVEADFLLDRFFVSSSFFVRDGVRVLLFGRAVLGFEYGFAN
jgi:hypothetical protein